MSVRVMNWVFEHSRSRKNARLVLLAIADCANDEGRQAYPSMPKLQKKTGLGERAVTALVAELERLGELVVDRNAGPRGCNLYQVVMTPAEYAPPQTVHPPPPQNMHPAEYAGVQELRDPPQNMHPLPPQKLRDPPQNMHPAEYAPPQKTTGTPAVPAPGTIKEPSSEKKTSSSSRAPRAKPRRRIPDDFAATPDMIDWAREHTPLVGSRETAAFIDYWRGSGTVKADWEATWRNWMRRAQTDAERGHARASPANGLVEVNGMHLKPANVEAIARHQRMQARQAAQEAKQRAIEGRS